MDAQIKYATSEDVHIAYRVFGEGPRDIILIPGTISHVELYWELAAQEYLLKRLTSFARVIVFDKRGQGLSDRVAEQTIEERTGDVRAVMDAAGSTSATIYGWSEGGPMCLMFAATYPERTDELVLYGTFASMKEAPWAVPAPAFDQLLANLQARWGEGTMVAINAPSQVLMRRSSNRLPASRGRPQVRRPSLPCCGPTTTSMSATRCRLSTYRR